MVSNLVHRCAFPELIKGDFEMSQEKSGPSKNAGAYDLRYPGLIMKDGDREVHEFIGMWPLKPDADLVGLTNTLAFSEFWDPPTLSFAKATTLLGLIRAARWFVGTSTEFGPTLYFISSSTAAWRSTSTTSCSTART